MTLPIPWHLPWWQPSFLRFASMRKATSSWSRFGEFASRGPVWVPEP